MGSYLSISSVYIRVDIQLYNCNKMASSIQEMYNVMTNQSTTGIEGYHVDNKYYDPLKIKEQRLLQTSKDRIQSKPPAVTKKPSFIDQVQKIAAKLPGPTTYEPHEIEGRSKTETLNPAVSHRKTIFDDIEHQLKKQNFPGAGLYDKVVVQADKSRLKGNISKAEVSNYLDTSMRYSIQSPGVGSYNSYHGDDDKRASKWVAQKGPKKDLQKKPFKLPPVGTYNPVPVAYKVFDRQGKKSKSVLNREQRFKKDKSIQIPYYNVLSEWGMKDKRNKKDILSRISSFSSNRSVYH